MAQLIAALTRRPHEEESPEALPPPRARQKGTHRQAVGASVRYLRTSLHLNPDDIVGATGIRRDIIDRLECGASDTKGTTVKDLQSIAAVLNCMLRVTWKEQFGEATTIDRIFDRGGRFRLIPLPLIRKPANP